MATSSFKTFLMVKGSTGSTYEKLIDIKEFPDLGSAPSGLDSTTLSDPQKVYIKDIMDNGGSLEFTANWDLDDYKKVIAYRGKDTDYAVWFGGTESDGSVTPTGSEGKFEFTGDIDAWPKGAGVSAVREMGVAIVPSTPVKLVTA